MTRTAPRPRAHCPVAFVRLTPADLALARALAHRDDRSVAAVMRHALHLYAAQIPDIDTPRPRPVVLP